ncbi:MAG: hypothetical protein GF347_04085 [Candidatus Moranbacteria bacterium]|nr:hypothetical protein [Candidatus Moranbacteria bacterium]
MENKPEKKTVKFIEDNKHFFKKKLTIDTNPNHIFSRIIAEKKRSYNTLYNCVRSILTSILAVISALEKVELSEDTESKVKEMRTRYNQFLTKLNKISDKKKKERKDLELSEVRDLVIELSEILDPDIRLDDK